MGTRTNDRRTPPVIIRNTKPSDLAALDALQRAAYPNLSQTMLWKDKHWFSHIGHFPDGQWVAEVGGKVVGCCVNLRLPFKRATSQHTWKEITGNGTLDTHDPDGDTLYGAEIMVHPDQRRQGIGKMLYRARFDYIREHDLRCFCAMGRIPGYASKGKSAGLSPGEYVQKVVDGEMNDRTLSAQIRSGCKVVGTVLDYLKDPKSGDAAAILIWENPDLADHAGDIVEATAEHLEPDLAIEQHS
jgi:ribosomal protein S18 acetylase RimI-like enzyme